MGHLFSVYAPMDMFYDDLCCTINSVCEEDILIVLGDFNARVGTATSEISVE